MPDTVTTEVDISYIQPIPMLSTSDLPHPKSSLSASPQVYRPARATRSSPAPTDVISNEPQVHVPI